MPNRILRESICTSEDVDHLSTQAEVFFYRLIVQADDFGRADGRPAILRARCFPLKLNGVTDLDVATWLKELVGREMVQLYEVAGKPYLQLTGWSKYQRTRADTSKFPDPPTHDCDWRTDDGDAQAPAAVTRSSVVENRESRSEKDVPAPAGASAVADSDKPRHIARGIYIDDHQQGLLHRLWQQRPDWVGQLTYPGFVKLMKEHGVRATNDALEALIEHAGQVERPYPYLAKIAAESHSVANQ